MKVLVASNELYPVSGGAVGTLYIARKFSEMGHQVVLTGPLPCQRDEAERELGFKIVPFNLPFKVWKYAQIRGPRYMAYALSFIPHFLRLAPEFDFVLVRNCVVGLSGALAQRIRRSHPVAISMTDLLSGLLYEDPYYPKIAVDILLYVEKQIAKPYPLVFVVSPAMSRELARAGVPAERIAVTYDGVDVSMFSPSVKPALQFDVPTVISSESLEWHHSPNFLAKIVTETQRHQDIQFLIVGGGPAYPYLERKMRTNHLVLMTNRIPYGQMPSYIASSDVGIVAYSRNYSLDLILTLKLLETLSMARPAVCSDLLTIRETFEGYEFVKVAKDLQNFVGGILDFVNMSKSDRERIGLRARGFVVEKFSWEAVATRIVTRCEQIRKDGNAMRDGHDTDRQGGSR